MKTKDTLICIVAAALMIYSLCVLLSVERKLAAMTAAAEQAEQELSALEHENQTLRAELEFGMSDERLQQLARERLGLVLPGEKIFYFVRDREE